MKKGSTGGVALLLLLLTALGFSIYLLYLNLPTPPKEYAINSVNGFGNELEIVDSQSQQFYRNMRFRDKKISYKIESACDAGRIAQIQEAFEIIEKNTILNFFPSDDDPEIRVLCSELAPESENEGYFIAGEGGPSQVINTTLYGVILAGKISLFREERCDEVHIALHELLHVLGFDHNENPSSIMFPTLNCDQTLDGSITQDINRLYSVKSYPDLKIVKVNATKSGRYLSFDIEIVNQGLKDAEGVVLSLYSEDKFIEDFKLEGVAIGSRKILEVSNSKIQRSSKKISFVVDKDNKIDEIFENNNRLSLILPD